MTERQAPTPWVRDNVHSVWMNAHAAGKEVISIIAIIIYAMSDSAKRYPRLALFARIISSVRCILILSFLACLIPFGQNTNITDPLNPYP